MDNIYIYEAKQSSVLLLVENLLLVSFYYLYFFNLRVVELEKIVTFLSEIVISITRGNPNVALFIAIIS